MIVERGGFFKVYIYKMKKIGTEKIVKYFWKSEDR